MSWLTVVLIVWVISGLFGWSASGFLIGEAYLFRQWWEWPVRVMAFLLGPVCVALYVVACAISILAWAVRNRVGGA